MGILLAIVAGTMLGFWAMPEKYIKNYSFENAWGLCYLFMLWLIPSVVSFLMIDNFSQVLSGIGTPLLLKMLIPGFLWGAGMMLWGKAINYIGMSLGFSVFIGTIIVVGSLLSWIFTGVPEAAKMISVLVGIAIILAGIIFNGRAGILRSAGEGSGASSSMITGIIIAVVGGLLCTGFNIAQEITQGGVAAKDVIKQVVVDNGNEEWLSSVASMFIVYVSGGLFVVPYFIFMLCKKNLWSSFKVPEMCKNVSMTALMAALNFAASIVFAYSSLLLGAEGGSVGYAVYNTLSVVAAVAGGLAMKEWAGAPSKAKTSLYLGLAAMVCGVCVIAFL